MTIYRKRLEGIRSSDELQSLIVKAADQSAASSKDVEQTVTTTKSAVAEATAPMPAEEAMSVLKDYSKKGDKEVIPISVVKAMGSLFSSEKMLSARLEEALLKTTLVYTAPPPSSQLTEEQRRFQRRLERLKLKAEENRYKNLTSNLSKPVADDVTTRSMTYAASVGLNMIVAPVSFGLFMYAFAGKLFSWVGGSSDDDDPNKTDIGRVITGVVCGVGMLFVEMILFVIRTHEFDASMRKKSKKSRSPFGYSKPKVKDS